MRVLQPPLSSLLGQALPDILAALLAPTQASSGRPGPKPGYKSAAVLPQAAAAGDAALKQALTTQLALHSLQVRCKNYACWPLCLQQPAAAVAGHAALTSSPVSMFCAARACMQLLSC